MNDEAKPAMDGRSGAKREPVSIDLPKSEVKDLTEATATSADAPAAPEAKADAPTATPQAEPSPAEDVSRSEDQPTAAPVPPPAPPKSGRGGAMALGAFAGAFAGVVGAFGAQFLLPPPAVVADPRIPALQTALGAAERKIATPDPEIGRLGAALKAAEGKLAAAETKLAALEQKPPQAPAEVTQRLQALDVGMRGLETGVKALEAGVTGVRAQAEAASRKVEDIEKLASAPPARAEGAPAPEAPRVDLAPVAARIVRLEEQLAEANARTAAGAQALASLDGRFKSVGDEIAALKTPRASEAATAVLAIAGMARRAFDQGEPVGNLVTAMGALGVPADDLKPLAALGDRPAPRLAALAGQLDDLASKLPRPVKPEPAKDLSVADRLKANIAALVDVRPAGAPRPADSAGVVAQAKARAMAGDGAGALSALEGLQPEQKAALKPFADAVAIRLAGLAALGRIEAQALAAAARQK
jgi:hypothetical protein